MSSGFLLSSFPAPPNHVPIPSPKYLPATFLVAGSSGINMDNPITGALPNVNVNGNGSGVEAYTGVTNLSPYSPSLVTTPLIRPRSSDSTTSSSSFMSFPTFPVSPGSSVGVCAGPPPALPLPPLPDQPSPISTEHQIALAFASYSSSKASVRSLKSLPSVESLRSVHSTQSQASVKKRLRADSSQSSQSIESLGSVRSSASLKRDSDSEGSRSASGHNRNTTRRDSSLEGRTTPTTRTAAGFAYASPSSSKEYEESIFDVELDFNDAALSDDDQIMIKKSDTRINSDEGGHGSTLTFPLSSHRTTPPQGSPSLTLATSFSHPDANPTTPFTTTVISATFNPSQQPGDIPGLGGPPSAVQTRSRSGTLTSVFPNSHSKRQQGHGKGKDLKTLDFDVSHSKRNNVTYSTNNIGSSSRARTYSQPSSVSTGIAEPHLRFQSHSHPIPPPSPYSTRSRAISSASTPPRILQASSSTPKDPFTFTVTSSAKYSSKLHPPTSMSTPVSPASVPLPPPIDVTEDHHDPDFTSTSLSVPSAPNSPSPSTDTFEDTDDRSTSPDLQTLLSHTSEVLRSGGRVRSSSRQSSRSRSRPRPRLKPEDKMRTSSMASFGSKRSTGSGSAESGRSAGVVPLPTPTPSTPSRNQNHSHATFGSSKQKSLPKSRLRSDSKSSLVSKSSTSRLAMSDSRSNFGSSSSSNAVAGPSSSSPSRASLMDVDVQFNDDQDVFREDDDDADATERDCDDDNDDAFSFFNSSSGSVRSQSHRGRNRHVVEDDPTLKLSFPIVEDDEDIIDLKTPLPHLLLRAGVLSPHSKLLPQKQKAGSSDEEDAHNTRRGRASPVDSLISSTTTSSKHPRDVRDTAKRRVRHKDGKLLRGGIGLTTGLGWSDSEDEDAPSEFTTRLKRLASMGGLSALSRKSSMASNISGNTDTSSMIRSTTTSGYGSVYTSGGSYSMNGHGYTPSISVSQSGSAGRLSTYTTTSTMDNASVSKRGSVYSEISVSAGYSGRHVNGGGGGYANGMVATTQSVSASASSSRNVSRQSSFSSVSPFQQSYHLHHGQRDLIIEDEEYMPAKDKERTRKTSSMVHVAELVVEDKDDGAISLTTSLSSKQSHSPSRRERNSTISISSTSSTYSTQSTNSTNSNSITLYPPSIAGSATPTPGTPTTPTPMSSFSISEPSSSNMNASSSSSIAVHPLSARQPSRLNTSHLAGGVVLAGRPHSPGPPPSPAPTGPLPPTPGGAKATKVGQTAVFGVSTIAAPASSVMSKPATPMSMPTSPLSSDMSSEGNHVATSSVQPLPQINQNSTVVAASSTTITAHQSSSFNSQHPLAMSSTPPTSLVRVTSPTPSFSMPTGSRTIHPPRSRAGSLSSSRGSSFSIPATGTKSKTGGGSIGSLEALGGAGDDKERARERLPYVVEDDGPEKSGDLDANDTSRRNLDQVLPSPIDSDAIAIVEMEPSEYGDGVAVALTGDEEFADVGVINLDSKDRKDFIANTDIDTHSIPEYPYRFDMTPPSPVISAKGNATGSFGFKRNDRPRVFQQSFAGSSSSPAPSSGLAKYSVSSSSAPSVAFSPASPPRQHESNASISSLDTSESTISLIAAGRLDHIRMNSLSQHFSVFGSGMGIPPPDEIVGKSAAMSRLTPIAKPQMLRNNSYQPSGTISPASIAPPSSSSAPSAMPSLLSRAASPVLARARAASPVSAISSMRVGSSLGFASSSIPLSSSSSVNGASSRRPTTPSSQLGLPSLAQRARGPSPVPPHSSSMSKLPSAIAHQPITPAPRKSSLPLPPSFLTTPGRPTSPPPPPPSAAGHMPSLLLRPSQGNTASGAGGGGGSGSGSGSGSLPRKSAVARPSSSPSPSPASFTSAPPSILTPSSSKSFSAPSPSPLSASSTTTKIASIPSASSIPSRSSSGTPMGATSSRMIPQPSSGRRIGTPGVTGGIGKRST